MGNRQFSLAVVKGASAGTCIQSARKRISVGSAIDNDLILTDEGVAPRHYLVVIDGEKWRVHALADDKPIKLDEGWRHPKGGTGAVIHAGESEVLLFPGDLSPSIISEEVRSRRPIVEPELPTAIDLPRAAIDRARGLTSPVVPVNVDEFEMAAMETVAARPPGDLRSAAQQMLHERRNSVQVNDVDTTPDNSSKRASSNPWEDRTVGEVPAVVEKPRTPRVETPVTPSSKRSAWDRAKKPEIAPSKPSSVPEVLATPESQVMNTPGSHSSTMRPVPQAIRAVEPEVHTPDERPAPSKRKATNAWGDKERRSDKALVPTAKPKNSWGDGHRRDSPRRDTPRQEPPRRNMVANRPGPSGPKLDLKRLAARGSDPALHILRHPDGEYSTSIRLLGARIQEFSTNLGYRAFMLSSAEPLTGKTTAALNLALALAEDTHRKVALIEANFRYPRLASIIGVDERRGLLPVLEGRARVGEAGVRVSDRNLVLLPTGGRHAAPAEVLASPRFKALLTELVETVDVAIVDAPSATPFADTNLLLPLVDAAFLVVAEGMTKRSWLGQAVSRLGERRLLGSLFNRIPSDERSALKRDRKERMRG